MESLPFTVLEEIPSENDQQDRELLFKIDVTCETDPELYDQPLTVWIRLPEGRWPVEDIQALDGDGRPIPMRRRSDKWNEPMLSVPPVSATYFIMKGRAECRERMPS